MRRHRAPPAACARKAFRPNEELRMADLNRLTATEAARKLATREITAAALLADCIERIGEREPAIHAWTHVDAEGAMRRARALDAGGSSGLLHGLPIAVKDLFDTFDMPTSYG